MNKRDPKLTVLQFNECINARDIDGLVALMTADHTLICYDHIDTNDIDSSRKAWESFFSEYPDYLNHFSRIESDGDFVAIAGHSTCSNNEDLVGKALWSARIEDDRISEWQVYYDTPENRLRLRIQ